MLAVGVIALVASAAPASAHAGLVRVVPGDGSTVTSAPTRVQLIFDEDLGTPADIVVTGPSGDRVERGTVQVRGKTAGIAVEASASGSYTVAFRVVSEDGHPVAGETTFRFAPGGTAQADSGQPSSGEHVGHAGAEDATGGAGIGRGPLVGIVAALALVAGLALLTLRRRPGGIGNPRRTASSKDRV